MVVQVTITKAFPSPALGLKHTVVMAKTRQTKPTTPADPWDEAIAHLRKVSPSWAERIERVGPCKLVLRSDRFGTLVRAIIGQQISAKAAGSIDAKVRALGGDPHTPEIILGLGEEGLRSCGLSGVKARYALNLAEAVRSGLAPLHEYHDWDDLKIVENLTAIKGIGPWTAEMFLIFALGRLDVLSVGDLGIRVALRNHHELPDLPKPHECRTLMEPLRPYRSIAMWYLWAEIDNPRRD